MGAQVGGKAGGVRSDINVTPLVDIVLVLLIIFIVITPAVNDAVRLPLARHSEKVNKEPGAKYLTLMLTAKPDPNNKDAKVMDKVLIDDQEAQKSGTFFKIESEADKKKLAEYIKKYTDYLADKRVFVKADADLPFKFVNELFQVCREGGADEASVVTSEDKSGKEVK
ncbi:MAG: biopolymer transporter ExbD [Acidobacteria bacterium]|nr:biopolymer transporter ExbD [Acidobacteriota bacterium]